MEVARFPRRLLGRVLTAAVVIVLLATTAACSSASAHRPGGDVKVTEQDFRISAPTRLPAGEVRLAVSNKGPDEHELIVVRSDASALPLRTDGVTVDEERLQPDEAGALEPGVPHETRTLVMKLTPGHYEMFCNMSGHYLGGMHTEFVVT